jgi:hypothetical protein
MIRDRFADLRIVDGLRERADHDARLALHCSRDAPERDCAQAFEVMRG